MEVNKADTRPKMMKRNSVRQKQNLLKVSWKALKGLVNKDVNKTIRNAYGVPLTNAGEDVKLAMDNALEASGHFNVIRKVVASGGIDAYPQFLGYSYLSGLQQNGFIRAGVEGLADEMTAKFIELIRTSDTENNDDDKIDKINEFLNKFQIKELFNKAAALNGYFGGCLIYIDTGDDDLLSALDEKSLNNLKSVELQKIFLSIYLNLLNDEEKLKALKELYINNDWLAIKENKDIFSKLFKEDNEIMRK